MTPHPFDDRLVSSILLINKVQRSCFCKTRCKIKQVANVNKKTVLLFTKSNTYQTNFSKPLSFRPIAQAVKEGIFPNV